MITLAIESAIAGGSISLLDDGMEVAHWIGTSNVSKAEDLIINIDRLLASLNIQRNEIGLVAASAGPGSFTGIRIGLATALGLKNGLGIPMITVSLLDAMIHGVHSNPLVTCAVPVGRDAVCFQDFRIGEWSQSEESKPVSINELEFFKEERLIKERHFFLYPSLYHKAAAFPQKTNITENLALYVGRRGFLDFLANKQNVKAIFVSKNF